MGGVVGLDYGPLFQLMGQQDISKEEWRSLFDDVRVIELEALDQIRARSQEK